jgi:hypothetical protein
LPHHIAHDLHGGGARRRCLHARLHSTCTGERGPQEGEVKGQVAKAGGEAAAVSCEPYKGRSSPLMF